MRVLRTNQHVLEHKRSKNSEFCENGPELDSRTPKPDQRQSVGYTGNRNSALEFLAAIGVVFWFRCSAGLLASTCRSFAVLRTGSEGRPCKSNLDTRLRELP